MNKAANKTFSGASPRVAVLGWGVFVPGYAGFGGWRDGRADPEFEKPKATIVPARQRRRASLLSRALADAYGDAVTMAGFEPATVASVFGSALGEASTMIGLLDQMWDPDAMLSPMKFATSVHNAASGMVSIATENRGFTTSMGADFDTPAMALLEGIGWVAAHDEPMVVCCGDEAPPADLVPDGAGWGLLAAAIALGPADVHPSAPMLSGLSIHTAEIAHSQLERDLHQNPNVGLLDLIAAVAAGETGWLGLDRGPGRQFAIELSKSAPA